MADKTPVRVVYSSGVATGLAEFQSTETVGYAFGGTGLSSIGSAGQVLRVNAAANGLEWGGEDIADILSVGSTLTAPSDADFTITTAGTGNIVLNDLTVHDSTLQANRSNDNLILKGSGTGKVSINDAYTFPTADGSSGEFLKTDGSGALSFASGGTTLSGSTNNTVATVTGANALAGEANLTFDGSTLAVTGAATISTTLAVTGATTLTGATTVNNSLTANSLTTNTISSNGSNADLSIQPSGTGDVLISALRVNGTTLDSSDSTKVTIAEAVDITGALVAATSINIASDGATVTGIKDEDGMDSDSATKLATQQSIKAYVDAQVTAQDLDFQGDSGGALSIDLDSETLDIAGGTGIDTSGSSNTLTVAIDSTVTTLSGSQTLTNKTLTSPVLNTGVSGTAVLDEDAMGSDSATQLATQQSIKAYADTKAVLTGSTNNTITTVTGAHAFQGETNLTFDGSTLAVTGAATVSTTLGVTGATTLSGGATILGEVTAGSLTTNTIASNGSNADVNITPQGTGKVIVNNLSIDGELGNIISSSSNMDITFTPHGTGSVVISQIKTNSVTGDVIPGKLEGTDFTSSLLVGHSTTGTLDGASENTGVGSRALNSITSGDNNSGFGRDALMNVSSGSGNTAVGRQAGRGFATKSGNTAIGENSIRNSSAGDYNTGLGYRTLYAATGDYNIGIGYQAGDNITSGSGNVVIGKADVSSATGDDQLSISDSEDGSVVWIKGTSAGAITFNSAYTFPTADGSDGQALVTDGSGTLTFGTVGSASASDDSLGIAISDKKITSTARTIDSFHSTFQDSVLYYVVSNDHYEDCVNIQKVSVTHNDTTAYCSSAGAQSKASTTMTAFTCDLSNDMVRLKAASSNAIGGSLSFYKFGLGDNSSAATSGNIIVSQNTDVDSAEESLVSFAHGTYRGAKLFVSVNNDAKTEVGNIEALVVHDGTTAYISTYGEINSGNNSLLTLTAAIDGSNVVVSAAGGEANLRVTVHAIMLKDTMVSDDGTYSNTEAIAPVTISSTATEVDTLVEASNNGAVYYLVSKNASEGHYAVNEVFMAMGSGEITVASGPFVSTKGTNQLAFTSDYKDDVENTGQLLCSSTSGGSTTVSAYRINCLAK